MALAKHRVALLMARFGFADFAVPRTAVMQVAAGPVPSRSTRRHPLVAVCVEEHTDSNIIYVHRLGWISSGQFYGLVIVFPVA